MITLHVVLPVFLHAEAFTSLFCICAEHWHPCLLHVQFVPCLGRICKLEKEIQIRIVQMYVYQKMEILWSIWFVFSLYASSSAPGEHNRNCEPILMLLLGSVEEQTCHIGYIMHTSLADVQTDHKLHTQVPRGLVQTEFCAS